MGIVQDSRKVPDAERDFSRALHAYEKLRGFGVQATGYLQTLSTVIGLCQEAISQNRRHGDRTYYWHMDSILSILRSIRRQATSCLSGLAEATIQHWCDQPVGQPSWTTDVDKSCGVYEFVVRALSEIQPDCAKCEEREMRCLEAELYSQALVARPWEWIAA